MYETFDTPFYLQRNIEVNYTPFTAEWQITGKSSVSQNNVAAYTTYGTSPVSYTHLVRFMNLDWLKSHDISIERSNYDLIYTAPLRESGTVPEPVSYTHLDVYKRQVMQKDM